MIYTYMGGLFGFSFVILSMAEMASMYAPYILAVTLILTEQGPDIWRSIPLGIGICATPVPALLELYDWLDMRLGLAYWNCRLLIHRS